MIPSNSRRHFCRRIFDRVRVAGVSKHNVLKPMVAVNLIPTIMRHFVSSSGAKTGIIFLFC